MIITELIATITVMVHSICLSLSQLVPFPLELSAAVSLSVSLSVSFELSYTKADAYRIKLHDQNACLMNTVRDLCAFVVVVLPAKCKTLYCRFKNLKKKTKRKLFIITVAFSMRD